MLGNKKTELSLQEATTLVITKFSKSAGTLEQLSEGEESQAFCFKDGGKDYVLRINRSDKGFKKEHYIYQKFHSANIPIPEVFMVGKFDGTHAFSITGKLIGTTLQDLSEPILSRIIPSVDKVLSAINDLDISDTKGFGYFDDIGIGQYESWHQYLLSIFNINEYHWNEISNKVDRSLVDKMDTTLRSLLRFCPEDRKLIHGDFGSNNVLTDGKVITGVLDWDNALYGDFLFDVAGAYFWSPWLECMEKQALYWEKKYNGIPNYRQRLLCYQLRLGLAEIYDNAAHENTKMLEWIQNRSSEIIKQDSSL